MIIIGIDPGVSGALAMMGREGLASVEDMPARVKGKGKGSVRQQVNGAGLAELLRTWTSGHDRNEFFIYLELAQAMPARSPTGKVIQGGSTTFSIGHSAGVIEGVIETLRIPYEVIGAARWKNHFEIGSEKEVARATAIRLFPTAAEQLARKKDHNRAEAMLIARYGYEIRA